MSLIPSNLARVPNLLVQRISLANVSRTTVDLLKTSQQISTGRDISRPSDDIVRAATIGVLDDRLDRSAQTQRNLSQASASLGLLDQLFGEATDSANQARSIASQQSSTGSSTAERSAQATVVDQLLAGLYNSVNRSSVAGYALGGSQTSSPPVQEFFGGYRYTGQGSGIVTDLGQFASVPITLGPGNPLGNVSTRVASTIDYNPSLTTDTQLSDLAGGRGLGVVTGTVQFAVNGGSAVSVDLSGAATVQDVITRVTSAIHDYETTSGTTVLGPGGVSVSGGSFTIDVAAGNAVRFADPAGGTTAEDLGLAGTPAFDFSSGTASGVDTNPKLTLRTPVTALAGISGALGQIKVTNAGRSTVVDLSGAKTLADIKNTLEGSNLGVGVEINAAGNGIVVTNQVSAGRAGALSISEVSGNNLTATRLGIRTLDSSTRLADFNFGQGVQIVDGQVDPATGSPSVPLNNDFTITLGDAAQTKITVDLRPQDVSNVQTLLDRINSQAQAALAAAGLPASAFSAGLSDGPNGIAFHQSSTFTGAISVQANNNSPAATQLGLLDGTYDPASATFVGTDHAKVRVDSLFSDLIDLRDGLRNDDTSGIGFASDSLSKSIDGLTQTRGLVGAYAQRVDQATTRETDRVTLDTQTRSTLADTDYASASARYSLLQTQLQASLQLTAASQGRTLLDYL
ncbi:MAG: hypothetical protein GC200_11975 [Tepidisphaera sp.]|nr:hypothetical protein [Tepidisphaera sp.]